MGILEYVLMAMFFSALLSFLAAYRDMDFSISDAIIASAFWPLSIIALVVFFVTVFFNEPDEYDEYEKRMYEDDE